MRGLRNTQEPGTLLLSARAAARALGISERTLWSLSAPRGDIPVVRVGHRVLYDPHDLQAWIERQKQRPETNDARP